MTTPKPSQPCACGCGQPSRPKSKYHSEKCQQRASRIKHRDYNAAYVEAHRRVSRKVYAAKMEVIIFDPMVADGYKIPLSEFEMYRSKYLPGTRVLIDGSEMVL